jgi:ABC-type sugar transport system permease subunit
MATAKAMLLFAIIFAVTGLQLYIMKKKEIEQ